MVIHLRLSKVSYYILGLCWFVVAVSSERSYRLPMEVLPYSYNIQLIPYLDEGDSTREFTFDGNISITVQALLPESTITLHASDITLQGTPTVWRVDTGEVLNVTNIETDDERDFMILNLSEPLQMKRMYTLTMTYTGNLQNNNYGFFRASYSVNGTKRWLAATQFEPVGARKAFPCFDEPLWKAHFNISILRPADLNSVSNMPLQRTVGPIPSVNGRYWDIFETSARMSTYLVAFAVSDFEALESGMYRVLSKPSTVDEGAYSLSISPIIIDTMQNLVGINYTLPKLDEIAVPGYGGAMENWGLIVFGESYLLLNNYSTKDSIASVVAHEISHQWFGDLVTLNWWKYTWLNEGFASYFQYVVPDKMFPEWNVWDTFMTNKFIIMDMDFDGSTHPLTNDVETPNEISNMFDVITYYKGSFVIKMLADILTNETFFKGLHQYLQNNAFNDGTPDGLFYALQGPVDEDGVLAEGLTVKEIMDTWTLQSGYPVITVTRNYTTGTAVVQQTQYFPKTDNTESNSSWYIPLTYTTSEELQFDDTRPSNWLTPTEDVTLQDLPGEDQWVIFNIQVSGFYRVNYDANNWKLLTAQLNGSDADKIPEYNRMQLQEDSRALSNAGLLDWNQAMDIVSCLWRETDPLPWTAAFKGLKEHYKRLGGSPAFPDLQSFYLRLMERFYKVVDFEPREEESLAMSLVRPQLLHWACLLGHEDCTNMSIHNVARTRVVSDYRLPAAVRAAQYCSAVRHNGETSWNRIWSIYETTDDVKERQEALLALGCTSDTKLLTRLMNLAVLEESGLKPEDRIKVFSAACNGRDATSCDVTLQFIESRVAQLAALFTEEESVPIILIRIASNLKTQEQVDMLQRIINKNKVRFSVAESITTSALKIARENVDWIKTTGSEIVNWLSRH